MLDRYTVIAIKDGIAHTIYTNDEDARITVLNLDTMEDIRRSSQAAASVMEITQELLNAGAIHAIVELARLID